jgi:hypothetical protein
MMSSNEDFSEIMASLVVLRKEILSFKITNENYGEFLVLEYKAYTKWLNLKRVWLQDCIKLADLNPLKDAITLIQEGNELEDYAKSRQSSYQNYFNRLDLIESLEILKDVNNQ